MRFFNIMFQNGIPANLKAHGEFGRELVIAGKGLLTAGKDSLCDGVVGVEFRMGGIS